MFNDINDIEQFRKRTSIMLERIHVDSPEDYEFLQNIFEQHATSNLIIKSLIEDNVRIKKKLEQATDGTLNDLIARIFK